MRKKRISKVKSPDIAPEMLSAWREAKTLRKGSDAYKAARAVLNSTLGLTKFCESPIECGLEPPAYFLAPERRGLLEDWCRARRLRVALEEAGREQP
jgi:hypothetical protein